MTSRNSLALSGAAAAVLLACAAPAVAQTVDAGAYVPAAPGANVGMLYAQYGHQGSRYANGDKVAEADIERYTVIGRYIHYGQVAGRTFNVQVLQPFGWAEGSGPSASVGDASGLGDTILTGQLFLYENRESKTFFGIEPYLYLPTGDYDADRGVNIGENRWKASLQAGFSRQIHPRFVAEAVADAMIFGDNDDFAGGRTLETEPLYRAQVFGRFLINPKNEASVRLVYAHGGETSVDGVERNDRTGTLSTLVTWRHNLTPKINLLAQVGGDLSTENGLREDRRVQFRLTRSF